MKIRSEQIADILDVCKELGITEEEYVNYMFTWGKWIIERSRERREIHALEPMTGKTRQLDGSILEKLRGPKMTH